MEGINPQGRNLFARRSSGTLARANAVRPYGVFLLFCAGIIVNNRIFIYMRKTTRAVISLAMPLCVAVGALLFKPLVYISQLTGPCRLYYFTGIYCPACGGTRSTAALLRGDILTSLRYNAFVIFLCLVGIVLYIEFVLKLFDIKIKIIPRSTVFVLVTLALFAVYFVVRNFFPYLTPAE